MRLSLSTYLPSLLGRYKQVGEEEEYARVHDFTYMYVHLTVGEQYICARIRVYTHNHERAATLIRDNRVGVYSRVDGLRDIWMYASLTHMRPREFRVVPVSREKEREGPGLSTWLVLMGMEKRGHDGQVATETDSYILKRWKKPIAFPGHEAHETASTAGLMCTHFHKYRSKVDLRLCARMNPCIGVAGRGISPTPPVRSLYPAPIHPQLRPRRP